MLQPPRIETLFDFSVSFFSLSMTLSLKLATMSCRAKHRPCANCRSGESQSSSSLVRSSLFKTSAIKLTCALTGSWLRGL